MTAHEVLLASLPSRDRLLENLTVRNGLLLICGWLVFELARAAYNISPLHPLYRIPGPKLAAATYLPEFWYDCVKFGRYTRVIEKMHQQYGPIVRINPYEVHCNDAQFVDEIYAVGGRKRDKSYHQVSGSTMELSGFGTADHEVHRLRRAPLAKFFSRIQIAKLETHIQDLVQQLCGKLLAETGKNVPINVQEAYSCFTSDAVADYCFGESFGFLAQDSFEPNFREPLYSMLQTVFLFRFFPFLKHTVAASSWLKDYLPEGTRLLIRTLNIDMPNRIMKTKQDVDAGIVRDRKTVFGELLYSDLPPKEKSVRRLADEAAAVLGGGTETASWTLSVLTYHLLAQPHILAKMADEMQTVVSDPKRLPPWTVLEKLPYFTAVLQEGLRLSYGIAARTTRVPTEEDLVYRGVWMPAGAEKPAQVSYIIPRGYGIGMSAVMMHHDEELFPDSHRFLPERWLDQNGQRRKELDRYLLSFSKGSRGCLGQNLALCELHLSLAALTLRVLPRMRLFETTEDDVKYDHDMFVPLPKDGSKGVRVVIV
ncbi:cytochrome P450 [Hypoxylon trugodes]|uniref:cytochrome P450 n=1 Tax=Hypoxylon trugodes TaxID=326681 RepID=UPI00219DCF5B|nr:cytochrome P450 [Hypoxylon trugodes]KAI1386875.1 cytochrome P450 [Hypoxylon trugodes]